MMFDLLPAHLVDELLVERIRQFEKFGDQSNVPDGTGGLAAIEDARLSRLSCQAAFKDGAGTWKDILEEEFCEAMAESNVEMLRAELIQVAAVACAWIKVLDKRGAL